MLKITNSKIISAALRLSGLTFLVYHFRQQLNWRRVQKPERRSFAEHTAQENILNAIIRAQEQERKRIAKDLHDSVRSDLSMIQLNLSKYAFFLKKKQFDNQDLLEEINQLELTLDNLRDICQDLYPTRMQTYGFIITFKEFIDKVNRRSSVHCNYRFNLQEADLFPDVENKVNLLRLFQEVLSNLLKYSECTELDIGFMKYPSAIKIILKHNGVPFDDKDVASLIENGKGLGLITISNRIDFMNGFIKYTRVKNGSEIIIELPLLNV